MIVCLIIFTCVLVLDEQSVHELPGRGQWLKDGPCNQRFQGRVRRDDGGVHDYPLARNQSGLVAEPDHLAEELAVEVRTETRPGLGEDTVIRGLLVYVVPQKPEPGKVQGQLACEPSLARYPVEVAYERHLEDNHRVHRRLPGVGVVGTGDLVDEREVDRLRDSSEDMVLRDLVFQREVVVQLFASFLFPHHFLFLPEVINSRLARDSSSSSLLASR